MISFIISGAPSTHTAQQKGTMVRGGKAIHYTRAYIKEEARRLFAGAIKHKPVTPLQGPLHLTLSLVFPMNKTTASKYAEHLSDELFILFTTSSPDWDNSAKLLCDVLSAPRGTKVKSSIPHIGFWQNDSQITDVIYKKRVGCYPRIEVTIRPTTAADLGLVPDLLAALRPSDPRNSGSPELLALRIPGSSDSAAGPATTSATA